ncbi:MAG TPA: hypothetical protein VKG25_03185, partial [Bryobacteraceae bacterium]|nr:hypothetical protein [Bryobacteraceae bacterium]
MKRFAWLLLALGAAGQNDDVYDVVLSGGKIVDGTGNPWFYGDIGVRGSRIARVTAAGVLDPAQ